MANEQNHSTSMINSDNELIVQPKDLPIISIEIRSARSMTCHICLENILTMHRQFGIQDNCDHVFCFDCLLAWRRTDNQEIGGQCPLCRTRSTFIAPSWRCFNNTADKQSLIDAHKLHLKTIPCRIFLRYGNCRFGRRCYYNHRISPEIITHENNDDIQRQPPRRIMRTSRRPRPY